MEQQIAQEEKSPKIYEEIIKSGLILGVSMFVFGLILLFLMQTADSFITMIILYPLVFLVLFPIIISVFLCRNLRKSIGGFWTFKQALKAVFILFFVGWLTSFGLNLVYTKLIDTTSTEKMQEHIKETTLTFMKNQNVDEDKISEEREKMDEQFTKQNELSAKSVFKNITIGISIIFVFALIFAAIFKRERPLTFQDFQA